MQSSKSRLWEALQDKRPVSSINTSQGKRKEKDPEPVDQKRLNGCINQSQHMNLIWIPDLNAF